MNCEARVSVRLRELPPGVIAPEKDMRALGVVGGPSNVTKEWRATGCEGWASAKLTSKCHASSAHARTVAAARKKRHHRTNRPKTGCRRLTSD